MEKVFTFIKQERYLLALLGLVVALGVAMSFGKGSAPVQVSAAGGDPIYMHIEGIDGEVTDRGHEKEMQVESWSWGMSQSSTSGAGGGGGAGKVSVHDISITKFVDKATPKLMLACASGKHFKEVVLTMRKAGESQEDYLKYSFFDVFCDAYEVGGTASDPLPTESLSLNFAEVRVEYKEQKPDGSFGTPQSAGWNFKQGKESVMPTPPIGS